MLPHGPLRTADTTICYEFQPFHEVGGDFLDFFTLTDGVIGIYLGDVTGKGLPAALYAALAMGTLRGVHKTGTPPATVLSTVNRRVIFAWSVVALRRGAIRLLRPENRDFANRQRRNGRSADSFRARLPGAGASRHSTGNVSGNDV